MSIETLIKRTPTIARWTTSPLFRLSANGWSGGRANERDDCENKSKFRLTGSIGYLIIHPSTAHQCIDRVSGSAVTTEFLQQARLGKCRAPRAVAGYKRSSVAQVSSALPPDGIGNANINQPREIHPLGSIRR